MRIIPKEIASELSWAGVVWREGDKPGELQFRRISDESTYVVLRVRKEANLSAEFIVALTQPVIHRNQVIPDGYYRTIYARPTAEQYMLGLTNGET